MQRNTGDYVKSWGAALIRGAATNAEFTVHLYLFKAEIKAISSDIHQYLPTYCSASEMFTVNGVADCKAVIRNLVHRFMMRLTISKHLLVRSILSSDLVCSSRIRRHWARLLYVHYHGG